MKNANTKKNKINIIFSSFLVIGYIVCTYFFSALAGQLSGTLGTLIQILMIAVFGLLLFYATRVGEGRQVRRFSLAVLLLIDLPSLYIILAALIPSLPFHDAIAPANSITLMGGLSAPSIILTMACVALGYGLPYTFFSGYEMKEEDEEPAAETEAAAVEGGLAEELAETEAEAAEAAEDAVEAAEETAEETAEDTAEEAAEEAVEEAVEETAEEAAEEAVEDAAEEDKEEE